MFGTLQNRLPQELRLAGITTMAEANAFLREVYLPRHNARFAVPAEGQGSAFVPFAGALADTLCIQEERTVNNDNTVRYKNLSLQIPEDRHRRHYRQGQGPGPRIRGRPPGGLPRPQAPGRVCSRRRADR